LNGREKSGHEFKIEFIIKTSLGKASFPEEVMMMDPMKNPELVDSLIDGVYYVDLDRKITAWNKAAERISGFSRLEVLGVSCADGILEHSDNEGRRLCEDGCPLVTSMKDSVVVETNVSLHNKKGHRIPVTVRTTPMVDANGKVIGCIETFVENYTQSQVLQELWQSNEPGLTDAITGAGNRHFCEITLNTRLYQFNTFNVGFGAIYIRLDQFKGSVDMYGRNSPDVLVVVARTLTNVLRKLDVVTRWENEDFIVIVPNMSVEVIGKVADRLRALIKSCFIVSGSKRIEFSASMGATLVRPGDTVETIVQRMQVLALASQEAGGNRVTL
jgi:diguanylate cyclase (GGDEF)-like protein/PAS domain S-box-containing protein